MAPWAPRFSPVAWLCGSVAARLDRALAVGLRLRSRWHGPSQSTPYREGSERSRSAGRGLDAKPVSAGAGMTRSTGTVPGAFGGRDIGAGLACQPGALLTICQLPS